MTNYLKTGAIFRDEFINIIKKINSRKENLIDEVYGSIALHERYTARPMFRLPNISMEQLKDFVARLRRLNVKFNYTLNTSYIGGRDDLNDERIKIRKIVRELGNIGIMDYTVTLPIIAEIIREELPNAGICVSTIAHIDTITQIKMWKEKYDVTGICMNLLKNRDICFLKNSVKYCSSKSIKIELMVNEFCGNICAQNDTISATHCIYREHCYQLHSIGYQKNEREMQYPMKNCEENRDIALAWLKQRFIRPEDMGHYHGIGIRHFKVTGRTADLPYMEQVLEAYATGCYDGNLLELWYPLKKIEHSEDWSACYLENARLDGFVDFWFEENFRCDDVLCGEQCNYCDCFFEKMGKKKK